MMIHEKVDIYVKVNENLLNEISIIQTRLEKLFGSRKSYVKNSGRFTDY